MADLRDFTKKNPIFVGTDGLRLPSGNSAQRVASANVNGTMRFNTDIAGMEMYTPTGWIRVQEEPISVRVNQQSGIATKVDCIDAGGVPNWITTAGTLGSIFGANTVNVYVSATDPEGTSVTYQITSGSLPGGLNFTTANGLIQGLASSVLANTTYIFTI